MYTIRLLVRCTLFRSKEENSRTLLLSEQSWKTTSRCNACLEWHPLLTLAQVKASVMTFITNLITTAPDLRARTTIRNELSVSQRATISTCMHHGSSSQGAQANRLIDVYDTVLRTLEEWEMQNGESSVPPRTVNKRADCAY
jgi:hypothetical protein